MLRSALTPTHAWLSSLAFTALQLLPHSTAHAQLTVPVNTLTADSVQEFTDTARTSFALFGIQVTAKGNTREVLGAYVMPITSITLGKSKYVGTPDATVKGSSTGSALDIHRTDKGVRRGVTLANFTVDYHRKLVLADVTPLGQSVIPQTPVYHFTVKRPLDLNINAQGLIQLDEQLVNLRLTDSMIQTMSGALNLPSFAGAVMKATDYGTLAQTILVKSRTAVPTTPYVAP